MDAAAWNVALLVIIAWGIGVLGLWFAIRTEFARFRAEIRGEIREFRNELKAAIRRVDRKIDA